MCEEVCCEVTGECELECWCCVEVWVPDLVCWWEVIPYEIWECYCEIFIDPLEIITKIRGKIFPLGYATHPVTVDPTAASAVFDITWAEGDLDLVLYSPNGTRIDPSVAANDTDVSYGETVVDKLHMAMYVIYQNIEPGDWIMEITATDVPIDGVNYYAIAYQISNLTLTLSTDKDKYNQSEPINIRADLRDNSTPLTGALVTVEIQRQDGTVDNIPLFDDGTHGDIQPDDGTYSNTYTNTTVGGQYNLIVHSSGTIDGYPFTRTISKLIAVEMQKAKFTNIYSDYGTDTDGDGLYNYLTVDTGINVNSAGNYTLVGDLYDINGNEIASTYNHTYLDVGNQTISLNFDGLQIYKHGADGPFNISYLALFDENDTLMCCRRDAYTTSAYNYMDFQALLVEFTSDYTDYGIDIDGEGLYEYLIIDVGVNVIAAGNYSLMGYLYDANGTEIVWATNFTHLNIGNQTVQLNFDGKTIYKQGIDGPYYLKYLGIYDENRKQIARVLDAYATSAYNYTDFEAPLAVFTSDYTDYGIDFDSDGLYDYLTIDVEVNVITAGNYSLMGYLYDVNESEIVWSIDYYGSLDVGNHTMHLDFDGKTIQMHGVNGPFYLKNLVLSLSGENWTLIDYIPEAYNTSAYNYTNFVDPVSTENEVTISGVGLGEISLIVSFKDTMPVFSGRYSYDLVGINVPQRPNNFTITASEVKNLKVGIKKIQDNTTRIWVTQTIVAAEGKATAQSDLPSPGNYHVKIFGDAADGASEVDMELTAVKKIKASGDFSLSIDISGFPAGKYTVTAKALNGCFTDLTLDGLPLAP
uniref:DUF4785 domain-containing protein n=1 Tax=Candidatus Methanophaga sp. ANME-1 ERB7 TaxID=2759913 RepID=A0A7G9ZBM4_9EURY|nr:hypothetical protein LLBILDAL_00018 [Methanosarcinales archaeon ANME-1 ERB7]